MLSRHFQFQTGQSEPHLRMLSPHTAKHSCSYLVLDAVDFLDALGHDLLNRQVHQADNYDIARLASCY